MTNREWKRRYMYERWFRKEVKKLRHVSYAEFYRVVKLWPSSFHADLLADCHD